MHALLPTVAVMVGCLTQSQDRIDAASYAQQLDPLLEENSLLAERVLHLAADVYNQAPAGDEAEDGGTPVTEVARVVWSREVVSLAGHLQDQAALVQPPAAWAGRHKGLVDIWSARADAYRALDEAVALSDDIKWQEGRAKADQAMLDEERWFREVNEQVSPYGLVIDQFP